MDDGETLAASAKRRRSHEALDMRVTLLPRVNWLLVAVLAALLAVALAWGFLGSIASTVRGSGVLVPMDQHIRVADAEGTAIVDTVLVEVGETVSAGQAVAMLRHTQREAPHEARESVVSPIDGVIYELRIVEGQAVGQGDLMVVFAAGAEQVEVLAFMEAEHARLVAEGMPAHVVPTTVEEAEFGSIRGEVTFISGHPMSRQALNTWLENPELVDELVQNGGPYLARIALLGDADSPNGFRWWSGSGPPYAIATGTLADVRVVVGEQAPITLVIPALRRIVGP